ncbi:hypothetical protein ABEY41_03050 [Peribacillus butanolivorans]|uniref:YjcQ family protein n=1 Tax=Peribacillus butanolivorans TaxID=421767 RepID=UPI003D281399
MTAKLDTKQKVLLGFYTEYQKDIPRMIDINAELLGITQEQFKIAIKKLESEGLISGAGYTVMGPITREIMVTPYGLNYVETKLGIDPTNSGEEKVKKLTGRVTEWGYNELKDFAVKVTAELIKG